MNNFFYHFFLSSSKHFLPATSKYIVSLFFSTSFTLDCLLVGFTDNQMSAEVLSPLIFKLIWFEPQILVWHGQGEPQILSILWWFVCMRGCFLYVPWQIEPVTLAHEDNAFTNWATRPGPKNLFYQVTLPPSRFSISPLYSFLLPLSWKGSLCHVQRLSERSLSLW